MRRFLVIFLLALPLTAQPQGDREEAIQTFRLQNGLRVLLLEDHQQPFIRLQFRALWAPLVLRKLPPAAGAEGKITSLNQPGQLPLESLAVRVLDQCAVGSRSRNSFNRSVEERGLSLRLIGMPDGPVWDLSGGSPEAEIAFSLLADATTRPIPEGADLDALRLRLIHALHEQGSQETARVNFLRQIERPDLALEPITGMNLGQIYLEDLQRSILATLQPDRAVLAISGDLNISQARQLVQLNFGTWTEGSGKPRLLAPRPNPRALSFPPIRIAADRLETSIALSIRASDPGQRAAQALLSLWLPRLLGSDHCQIHAGAAGWYSLILTAEDSEESLRTKLSTLKKVGLKATDLEQAKMLWLAAHQALALHPHEQLALAAQATLLGAEPTEREIQAVDLGSFNETASSWLDLGSAQVLMFSSESSSPQKTNQDSTPNRVAKSR